MPIKTYLEEFKRDAVALYENSPGTSIQKIANDLGINRMTLKNWIATAPDRLGRSGEPNLDALIVNQAFATA